MKKIITTICLFSCLSDNAIAQELSQEYFAICNDFLKFLDQEQLIPDTSNKYIWPVPDFDSTMIFGQAPYNLETEKPWVCYQIPYWIHGRDLADTIRLSAEDMGYLFRTLVRKHNKAWRNKLSKVTGLLASEPSAVDSVMGYTMLSAPLFLQENTVCVVYEEYNSIHNRGGCYKVYKRDRLGWAFIDSKHDFNECHAERIRSK